MNAAKIIVPSAYILCFFPMVVAAWYDIIDHKWQRISQLTRYYWYMATSLSISCVGTCAYMAFQTRDGDIGEVGSGILALLTSIFLWHKLFRAFSIVHEHKKMKDGPIQMARRTLASLVPAESDSGDIKRILSQKALRNEAISSFHIGSREDKLDENVMMGNISSTLFDDDYPRSASARVKLLRPFKRPKEVLKDDSEELSTAISIYMRLATISGKADIWTCICSTHRLITAETKRVSLGKQLVRLITFGSLGKTPGHASKRINGKWARNPIQNLLLNNTFKTCVKEKHKSDIIKSAEYDSIEEISTKDKGCENKVGTNKKAGRKSAKQKIDNQNSENERKCLEELGVQMYWIGVEQSKATISEIQNQFPHKFAQGYGKSGEELIVEIAILLILQNSPGGPNELRSISPCRHDRTFGENSNSAHETSDYVFNAHEGHSWFDKEFETDVFDSCAKALVHYSEIAETWLQNKSDETIYDEKHKKSKTEELSSEKYDSDTTVYEDILLFFKILCHEPLFKHVFLCPEKGSENRQKEFRKISEDVPPRYNMMPIADLVITSSHVGRVVHALFDDKTNSSFSDRVLKRSTTSEIHDDPTCLREAMERRHLTYCGESSVRDAEIVWGLAGLLTQLELTRSDVVGDTLHEKIQDWDLMPPFRETDETFSLDPEDEANLNKDENKTDHEYTINTNTNTNDKEPRHLGRNENMLERLDELYKKKMDTNKYDMLSTELWLLGFELQTHRTAPSPNNYDIVAAHAEMATCLSHGVVAVMRKIVQKYKEGEKDKSPFRVVFPARTHGDPKQFFRKWMDYKLDMQGQRRSRRTTYATAEGRGEKGLFDKSLLNSS